MSQRPVANEAGSTDDEYWTTDEQKVRAPSVQTPRKYQVNRPPEAIAQSSIASAHKYNMDSPAAMKVNRAPFSTPGTGASVFLSNASQEGAKASSTSVTTPTPSSTGKGRFVHAFNKVSSQLRGSTPVTQGRKSDLPMKIPQNAGYSNHMETPSKTRVVVVINDSDSDEEATDAASGGKPSQTSARYPLMAESSQSSMDSMFSRIELSSSMSSIESTPTVKPAVVSKAPVTPARPAVVNDIFMMPSPNVTRARQTSKRVAKYSSPLAPTQVSAAPYVPKPMNAKVPESVLAFSASPFGTALDANIIAHCDETQVLFDRYRISWGTQYELSRGVIAGAWSWADVRAKIQKLKGTNEQIASRVKAIMCGQDSAPPGNVNLWKELDREQVSIEENIHRGLGLCGDFEGAKDWYGGQIQQLARLLKKETGGYKLVLEEPEKRRSNRFARYYGSSRFLQVKIPSVFLQEDYQTVKDFLTKKFVLCGRVFIPFHSREEGLYMVQTNEDYNRKGALWGGDVYRKSYNELINWHNPLDQLKNADQVMTKYVTRFALALSNSVPALEFEEQNIFFIEDITSEDWPAGKPNPPADKLMTDGCGFMNHAALQKIVQCLGLESIPAGVQGRIDGSKGFWILHPHDRSIEPKIWIRTSQNKIKNRSFDRAHRIFDHLAPSKPTPSSAISAQSIINLFSNNVPEDLLIKMMEEGLENEVAPFLEWDGPNAMLSLAHAICKSGNVTATRTQRLAASLNRALGLKGRDWGARHVEVEDEGELADDDTIALTGRNKYSGGPASFHEMAFELIQAGFNPQFSKYLAEKVKFIISSTISRSVEKYRIPIEESLGAYVVPDPLGVLEEGEIYYKFSTPRKNPRTDMLLSVLEGDVVLGRYPIHLPSDMQKAKAVDRQELSKWPDVVIVSTKGKRSLASLLADGDMDGDELIAIWDSEIVENFQNQPFTNPPDGFMEDNFERDVARVEKFCDDAMRMTQKEASKAFLTVLLSNLSESKVGLYSKMHDNAVIKHGYGHPEAVRLAYVFNTLLDASKSGRRLKSGIYDRDRAKYLRGNFLSSLQGTDILRILSAAGQEKGKDLMIRYEKALQKALPAGSRSPFGDPPKDLQLLQPYNTEAAYALKIYKQAPQFGEDLRLIRNHVDAAHQLFKQACDKERMKKTGATPSPTKKSTQPQKKAGRKDIMLAAARAYAAPVEGVVLVRQLEQVKASFAYQLSEPFGFAVAFQELCHIKAMAAPGGVVANTRMFDEAKSFASSFMRTINRCDDDYYT